jgi:Cupin-like domain
MRNYLDLDRSVFRSQFGRQPFLVRHHLVNHPLFALPRLVDLARRLPEKSVEYNAGDVPVCLDPAKTPRNGLSPEETIRRIEECRSWLALRNVEQDAQYRALLGECIDEVRPFVPGAIYEPGAFIFVSSPGAVAPYHMDPEENLLLQIRGRKQLHVFDPSDRSLLSEEELERFYSGAHCNLVYREAYASKAQTFELAPGFGAHIPLTAPHWVQNGAEVSISFSVTMNTDDCYRLSHVHRLNARLRRWGMRPSPVGQSLLRDGVKQLFARAESRLIRMAQGRP